MIYPPSFEDGDGTLEHQGEDGLLQIRQTIHNFLPQFGIV